LLNKNVLGATVSVGVNLTENEKMRFLTLKN